jgi:hypothetical protein
MLRPEFEGEIAQGGFGHNGLASAAVQRRPLTAVPALSGSSFIARMWIDAARTRSGTSMLLSLLEMALVTLGASDDQQDRCTVRHALRHHGRRPGRGDRDWKASNCGRVPARRHARTAAVIFSRLFHTIGAQC